MEQKKDKRKNHTDKLLSIEVDLHSDPTSPWNTTTFIPLAQVKLLASESLNKFQGKLSQETIDMLNETLNIPEKNDGKV